MSRKVFISFRYSDGNKYKELLTEIFDKNNDVINCSENIDRSMMSEATIKKYLYDKLKNTSVTIVLLTPEAINYRKDWYGNINDWIYDEVRYSLEDRENNRCNGLIAVYTPEVKDILVSKSSSGSTIINDFNNLVRKNMFNIFSAYKNNKEEGYYNANLDHYCSLVSWDDFIENFNMYIEIAEKKREEKYKYDVHKKM